MTALAVVGGVVAAVGVVNLVAALTSIMLSRPLGHPPSDGAEAVAPPDDQPFVSVHVATHDEPPTMVIATIEALARSAYPAFEVIVIDNNTVDPDVWRPVARRAAELGDTIRFHHRDGVRGAKAGALNIALALTDPRATYVAVVDADYLVAPDFISRGVASCGPDVQFVQFPQVYRNAVGASAVVAELADYFETFPRAANRAQAALLTGTLSVISIEALRAVGGWPTRSITEDAELGVTLWARRARGLFVDREVGNGLLPMDLAGLRLQRQRWVGGNFQTLLGLLRTSTDLEHGAFAVIAQLTAWMGMLAWPLASLVAVALVRALAEGMRTLPWQIAEGIAVATILCVLADHAVRALRRGRLASMAVTMSLLWTSSFAWLTALGPRPLRFRRTPKTIGAGAHGPSIDTLCSSIAAVTAVALALEGAGIASAALTLTSTGLLAGPLVDGWLRGTASGRGAACAA